MGSLSQPHAQGRGSRAMYGPREAANRHLHRFWAGSPVGGGAGYVLACIGMYLPVPVRIMVRIETLSACARRARAVGGHGQRCESSIANQEEGAHASSVHTGGDRDIFVVHPEEKHLKDSKEWASSMLACIAPDS